ncbi:MAG: SDR family oxidoreductase [Candidatus Aminicenantia bacterium]
MNNKTTCLVTGGAGFIGSHLVDALIEKGDLVLVIDNLSTGKKEYINPKAKFFEVDLGDFKKIRPVFEGVDFVFHLAAVPRLVPSIQDPISAHQNNLTSTLNVLVASKEAKVKKLIYASSTSVYGNQKNLPLREETRPNPLNPYALQKYAGELYCKIFAELYGFSTVSLRYFNVFGPRQSSEGDYACVIGIFLRQKKEGKPLTIVGDGNQRRDFSYVKDVVRATILAAEKNVGGGEVINVAAGNNYSVNELAEIIGGPKINIPLRPGEIRESLADISKAKKLLGWEPKYNLETGLKEIMKDNTN